MKKIYKFWFWVMLWYGGGNAILAQTKKETYLGTIANVVAAYKGNAKAPQTLNRLSNIRHTIPGIGALELAVKNSKKEAASEVFSGPVGKSKNDYFFLKISGKKLSGYIVLKDRKMAYEYTSTSNGEAYLKAVDIDKVLCLDYLEAKRVNTASGSQSATNATSSTPAIPILQSLPGATAVVYLDFDGQKVSSIYWNEGNTIDAKPANLTQDQIKEVWKLISEDYRPFALNITTSEAVYNNAPADKRMRVIFTPTNDAAPGYGGVAYVGSFTWGNDTPCWVFNERVKGAGEAGSHEVGHTLGLSHDGRITPAENYFSGQNSWAPIMGIGYNVSQVQWSKGEYPQANNTENDLSIITTHNGFSYRADDHGNTSAKARPLVTSSTGGISATNNKGIISTQSDIDVFSFTAGSGAVTINVNPNPDYPNLDVQLTLKNSAGTTVASSDPEDMSAALTPVLSPGTYYLFVAGGKGSLGANSDYGSLGEYSISGNLSSSYCTPVVSEGCDGDYIHNFTFNTLSNKLSGCNGQPNSYISYEPKGAFTTSVVRGQSYNISLQSGPDYPQGFGVWIDYNNNNDFNDAGEFVYNSPSANVGEVYKGTITIPGSATTGQRRLRVRAQYSSVVTSNQACTTFEYGETEDYTISITNPTTAAYWDRRFGGSGTEGFAEVVKTTDGGYLLAGYSSSGLNGNKSQSSRGGTDYWIIKTDAAGNKTWDQRYGGTGNDYLNQVIPTADGGYLLGGSSESGLNGDKTQASRGGRDYWIVKVSSTGVKQWDKRFGGSGYEDLRKMTQLSSGEYILGGYSDSPAGGDKSQASQGARDYWLVKISSTGTRLWDKRYGGTLNDQLEGFLVTSDGGFLLGGASASGIGGDKSQAGRGVQDYWVVRTDKNGVKLWDERYGGTGDDQLCALGGLPTGEFFLAGTSSSGSNGDKSQPSQGGKDFWTVKISSNGTKLWDKRFGGSNDEELRSVMFTSDGGFLLGGKSASGISGDKSQASQGNTDYWLVKTTSTGSKQWDRRYGGSDAEELRCVVTTSDNNFLLGGRSESGISGDKTQNSFGSSDYWLIKVGVDGSSAPAAPSPSLAAGSAASAISKNSDKSENSGSTGDIKVNLYPNPFVEKMAITFYAEKEEALTVQIFDSQGRPVKNVFNGDVQAGKRYEWVWQPDQPQKPGIYLVRVLASSKVYQYKVILLR